MLNKNVAGTFAFFLGMFGAHRFYLGQRVRGALQFFAFLGSIFLFNVARGDEPELFFALILTSLIIIPILTGIVWWATPRERWDAKYNKKHVNSALPAVGAPPADTRSLKAEGIRYYRTGDYDLAIEAFQDAAAADLGDAGVHFNLACSYAQLGQYGEALRHLETSVTFGLPKPERIEKHPALAALRKTEAYRAFRSNNFRRLNLIELTAPAPSPTAAEEVVPDESDSSEPPAADYHSAAERAAGHDLLQRITRLRELHDAGVLTQQEYQAQKEKLMG